MLNFAFLEKGVGLVFSPHFVTNNNIRSAILEIKNDRCKIVKILAFPSLSREHFQTNNKRSTVLLFAIKTISLT